MARAGEPLNIAIAREEEEYRKRGNALAKVVRPLHSRLGQINIEIYDQSEELDEWELALCEGGDKTLLRGLWRFVRSAG